MDDIFDDVKKLKFKIAQDKINISSIKRSIVIFSYLCAFFVFSIGIVLAYGFLKIDYKSMVIVLALFFLLAFITRRFIYNCRIKLSKKKYGPVLNELIVLKLGSKKIVGFSFLTIFSSVSFFLLLVLLIVPNIEVVRSENVILGAHRGDSVLYTENTIEAFESALNNDSYKFIEFDVQFTKDNKLVVHHDLDLFRLQGKSNKIKDLTYEELQNVSNYHIPLYSEVMDLIDGKKRVNVEIKSGGNFSEDILAAEFVIEDCRTRGVLRDVIISSISLDIVSYIESNYYIESMFDIKTGLIIYVDFSTFSSLEDSLNRMMDKVVLSNVDYLMLHASNLRNYELIKKLKPMGKEIVIWYFNNEMYIITSEEGMDGSIGDIVGRAIGSKGGLKSWNIKFFGKKIL